MGGLLPAHLRSPRFPHAKPGLGDPDLSPFAPSEVMPETVPSLSPGTARTSHDPFGTLRDDGLSRGAIRPSSGADDHGLVAVEIHPRWPMIAGIPVEEVSDG